MILEKFKLLANIENGWYRSFTYFLLTQPHQSFKNNSNEKSLKCVNRLAAMGKNLGFLGTGNILVCLFCPPS